MSHCPPGLEVFVKKASTGLSQVCPQFLKYFHGNNWPFSVFIPEMYNPCESSNSELEVIKEFVAECIQRF